MLPILERKTAGIVIPMFSMRSNGDWGVGDFSSLEQWINCFADAGASILQILPINEISPYETGPYSALSSFAIDPIYIDVQNAEDVINSPRAQKFIASVKVLIEIWHKSDRVYYNTVRDAKLKTLLLGFSHFLETQWDKNTPRALEFKAYIDAQTHWIHDYARFRALKDFYKWQTWTEWPENFKNADKETLRIFEANNFHQVMFFKYIQWVADGQIARATAAAKAKNMLLFGDIPFGINLDSADVWAERGNFNVSLEVGAPPDQFSTDGQRWGLPAYDWLSMQRDGFSYWKRKIRRAVQLYDVIRLDHLVGFFRTYVYKDAKDTGHFDWLGDEAQRKRGYEFLNLVKQFAAGKTPVGEDLGVIPDFAREVMAQLQIPGYKILRWEKDNGYYREPRNFPKISVAAVSTHDTETLRDWWESMPLEERANIWEMISTQRTNGLVPFTAEVQETILRRLLQSGSSIVMLSVQDICGTMDRINTPGLVSDKNWTYRFDSYPGTIEKNYPAQITLFKKLLAECNRTNK
ncbi:MAG: 4-alpha-glucanotransferase [Elusimicrobium sp.]|jgi:4-alpha-glucanotransferase|nr:4-alpha-glucanotransferase [Elusimicrobium sp.]